MIGCYGNIKFEVSSDFVRTFQSFSETHRARYVAHDVLDCDQKLQFTGTDLPSVSLTISLASDLTTPQGRDVQHELGALRSVVNSGKAFPLVIGSKPLGRFVLEELTGEWKRVDGQGRVTAAGTTLKLRKYA